ncbi:MAG TPA: hypothetical protein V6D47_21535 [Oscillatoriaceae cyanobacterium]
MPKLLPLLLTFAFAVATLPLDARAATVDAKPRIAISLAGGAQFARAVQKHLLDTHRFDVVMQGDIGELLAERHIKLDDSISVQDSLRARAATNVDMVLDGRAKDMSGNLRITSRLFDLRTGEYSRDLALMGDDKDLDTLAGQLANFVRQSVPIRCLVRAVNDDQIVMDLGAMDGVTAGSVYRIYRDAHDVQPVYAGTIQVTSVQPFAAVGEQDDVVKGVTPQVGDALVEETSGLLLNP